MSAVPPPPLPPEDPQRLQARLQGLLEVALDCIISVDHEGRIIDFNPAAERTFGYAKAEALGREMAELIIPPALRQRHRDGMSRLAQGHDPRMIGRRVELTAQRRDGSEFPVELAITRIELGPAEPPVYTAHLRDITDRQQTETALLSLQSQLEERIAERTAELRASEASLRESQELFAKSFDASPAMMTIARLPEGELIEVNAAFQRTAGLPRAKLIGRTSRQLGFWHQPHRREQLYEQIRRDGCVRDFETEFRTASGDIRTVLLNGDRIEIGGGACLLTVGIDISERRRREEAEAALARAEASYRSIFENALEGLYQSLPEGRFLKANPALARMFGYDTPEELISSVNDIGGTLYVQPGRRVAFFALLGERDEITDFESEVYRRDGSRMWISESVRAIRDREGNLLHLEGLAIDITAQREAARALAEAKEAADAANRAKSQFLASMSHELRTPLNGILGYTQILSRDSSLGLTQRRGVQVIQESAEHLLGLINDVLDLSKVEAGRLELHQTACDLPGLVSSVAELLGPRARAQGLGFATTFSPDLPRGVMTDQSRLRQVLLNLLANAIKFTREGSVLFSVQAGGDAPPGRATVLFSVSDTGAGIAESDLPRLFQPFVQVGGSGCAPEGTGLGLAISRSLVSALGGQLQVESRPGWGSRFWFELVLPLAGPDSRSPLPGPRAITGYHGPPRRILVVDDHPANREVLAGLLQAVGFVIEMAESGDAALAACARQRPDAVLMDLRMPGMSGIVAAEHLRRQHGPSLPLIAVSASAFDIDRQTCLAAGYDEFLAKPVQAEELWRTLGECLALEWVHAPARPTPATLAPFAELTEPPPRDVLQALHDLARAGDVVGLRNRAEALAAEHPQHLEFARALLELAGNFKLKAIRQLVSPWLEGPDR